MTWCSIQNFRIESGGPRLEPAREPTDHLCSRLRIATRSMRCVNPLSDTADVPDHVDVYIETSRATRVYQFYGMHVLADIRAVKCLLEQVVPGAIEVGVVVAVYLNGIRPVVWSVGTINPKGCCVEADSRCPICSAVLLKGTQVITIRGYQYQGQSRRLVSSLDGIAIVLR